MIINENFLKDKYSKEETKQLIMLFESLKKEFKDEKSAIASAEEIAEIVIRLKLDVHSVSAAIIFPFAKLNNEAIAKFSTNKEVANLLEMLLAVERFSRVYTDADGLKEMLLAITKDIRVIIIKSAQILDFARKNVQNVSNERAIRIFKSIDDIYSPIAARLGLSEIKSELQDLSFQFHKPEEFRKLVDEVKNETRANKNMLTKVVNSIKDLMNKSSVKCDCYGRIKHISSIYNKITSKHCSIKNIYDIAAVRILVENVSECYMALGLVHSSFVPVDGRFKDYIANPKPNGYQSLHTTVHFQDEFFEVQIRTYAMHEFAEYGVAAHFLYKEHKRSFANVDKKLLSIRKLLENKETVSSRELLEELKTDVYLGEIFVQSPMGKVVKLVENSTPIDFAYAIHSDVGNKCVGAKVNGVMVSLTSTLSNGDVVEILTATNSKGPSRDWLKHVKLHSTKQKINSFFKKQMKDENIKLGKSMLEQVAKSNEISLSSLLKEDWYNPILKRHALLSLDELFAAVGCGSIGSEKVVNALISARILEEKKNRTVLDQVTANPVKIENKAEILGAEGMLTNYCKCCNPIPGDDIVGYVSRGRGIVIHNKLCENVEKLEKSRFIKVDWNISNDQNYTFTSIIDILAKNNGSIYIEITNALAEVGVKVQSINTSETANSELVIKVGVLVKDKNQLSQVKNKLSSLKSVYEVK